MKAQHITEIHCSSRGRFPVKGVCTLVVKRLKPHIRSKQTHTVDNWGELRPSVIQKIWIDSDRFKKTACLLKKQFGKEAPLAFGRNRADGGNPVSIWHQNFNAVLWKVRNSTHYSGRAWRCVNMYLRCKAQARPWTWASIPRTPCWLRRLPCRGNLPSPRWALRKTGTSTGCRISVINALYRARCLQARIREGASHSKRAAHRL